MSVDRCRGHGRGGTLKHPPPVACPARAAAQTFSEPPSRAAGCSGPCDDLRRWRTATADNNKEPRGEAAGTPLCIVVLADGLPAGSFPVAAPLLPDELVSGNKSKRPGPETRPDLRLYLVGATGFEPVTSSVSANSEEALC